MQIRQGAVSLAIGAGVLASAYGAGASVVFTADLTHASPDLAFSNGAAPCNGCSYSPGGDVFVLYTASGATLGEPAKAPMEGYRRDYGLLETTFTVLGDFTATLTFDASDLNQSVSNLSGDQTQDGLEAEIGANDYAYIGQIGDENGNFTTASCSPSCPQTHYDAAHNTYGQVLSISRTGDLVTLTEGPSYGPQVETFQGSAGSDPATLLFEFGGYNNNPGADSVTYETFTITADGFSGLSTAPEPAAWTMLLLGFGALGAGLRRRRGVAGFA